MASNNSAQGNNPFTCPPPSNTSTSPETAEYIEDGIHNHPLYPPQQPAYTEHSHNDINDANPILLEQASIQPGPRFNLNPAILLNPKGYGASTPTPRQDAASRPFNNASNSADIEFQFTTPQDNFTTTPQPAYTNGQFMPQPNNFAEMIDRTNNVEQRMFVPQSKRRKVEAEDSIDPMRALMGGSHGGSGELGQYVQEKRRDGSNQPNGPKQVEAIDLTDAADESDLVSMQDFRDEEVCYGMIQNAKLNCHIVPSPKPGAISLMPTYWPQVKIVLRRKIGESSNIIHACDHTRRIVGAVDPETSSGLATLLDSRLQLRTDCRIPSRPKVPGEESGRPTSTRYTLDLMLYGPRKSSKPVAKHLSQRNIWLRNPPRVDNGIKYENPQLVEGPRPPPAVKEQPRMVPTTVPSQTMRSVEEIRSEVMGVFDSLTKNEELPEMEPCSLVQTELLKHQKQGLYFMTNKEQPRQFDNEGKIADSFWQLRLVNGQNAYYNVITGHTARGPPPETYGGILADMMGLGKTLSILSLVAGSLDEAEKWSKLLPVQPQAPPPSKKKASSSGQFDVPAPQPLALTPLKQNGKATLLICPLSTITNWEEQIKAHIKPGGLKYYIYHGSNRIKDPKKLAMFDIVLTTYGSVASEVASRNKGKIGPYPLEEVGWFRVVLDEAHMIREQSTLQFKAICRLQACRRWAVTGTPVQNKLDDLAALLAFLRLKPFDEKSKFTQYITAPFKVCDPEIVPKLRILVDSITLRRLKDKIDLPPRTDEIVRLEFSPAERKLYDLFEKNAQDKVKVLSAGREKMIGGKTYIHILQSILRLRLISAHGKDLLSDDDLEVVQGMTQESAIDLDSDEDDEKSILADSRAYEAFELMQETNNDLCISCQRKIGSNDNTDINSEREEDTLGYMTACFHLLCTGCIDPWKTEAGNQGSGTCPYCREYVRFTCNEIRKSKVEVEHEGHNQSHKHENKIRTKETYTGYSGPHTKTRALVDDLLKAKADSEAQPDEPPFKSVVFSAWTSHLDLIQIALDSAGIRYTRLDGKMSRTARTAAMDAFREDRSVHVILVSIMAGGLGLNLTSGNYVYVMEPQYNPAAEAQAVDRVHRLGQKRPVRTVRYIMQNSIEEKMLDLQEKKKKLASLSMDRNRVMDKAEAAKQKLMDLRSLFK
ncbi:SNF2 family N-terminal domain-containing protein [Hypoxylon trugodes]|uniref:SNF2 family N-terminal domain-containing protein n=1 Tax=Hypoxylon trugodes TaxID=326681 RepID=UPI00219E6FF0|nr:SNF2 family N-terminal domain-containing protein [Hypoxylon trugodes]KAI1386263.1 SNF2 family N-terminal domain-containing protein [Hypoxylon trugodes]